MEPGSDGPAIFYPELRQNHLALAFTNQRWMQEVVMRLQMATLVRYTFKHLILAVANQSDGPDGGLLSS